MKRLLSGLLALSFTFITGCNTATQNMGFVQGNNFAQPQQYSSYARKPARLNANWFETLSPELQNYYAPARGKTGVELFNSLNDIISRKNSFSSYNSAKSFMYSTVDNVRVNNKPGLFDAYSYIFVPGSGGNGNLYKEGRDENQDGHGNDFINCEHTWPQSFFNKQMPMVADLHHLFPTMSVPNGMRSNHPLGMANGDRMVIYTTSGGSKLGVIDSKGRSLSELKRLINLPYNQRPNLDKELDAVFEPGDKHKGNTARAMLYFYLRYFNQNIRSGAFDEKKFWDSKVSTFISWSEQVDPADAVEKRRNDIIFQEQGNRNPFVDIPGLASLIGEQVFVTK